jgi:hypothetical protein
MIFLCNIAHPQPYRPVRLHGARRSPETLKHMNTAKIKKTLLLAIGGVFVWWAWKSPAQEAAGATAYQQMPYAVSQVLELEQAKIGDSTVIAYIRNSGTSYNLNAEQIVFLRQQGVSDGVITAMLTQPRMADSVANIQPPEPAPQPVPVTTAPATPDPTVISQPSVTYVQTTPAYDYSTYYYPYPNYSYYGWPFCWTWFGGAWHWGWRGGWAGWHGGGGWHGTWGGGWHGGSVGGWHGGWGGHSGGGWHGGGGGHGGWGGGSHGGWSGHGGFGGGHGGSHGGGHH